MRLFPEGTLLLFGVLVLVLFLLPLVLSRFFSVGVIKRASAANAVALTFDDGPHPEYTPKVLDLLDAYGAKATFFVIGYKARQYPELIRSIAERGHEIGLHNPIHRSNWFYTPWRLRRELDRMADEIGALTGRRPICYRPPWGVLSLADYWFLRPYRLVLWSFLTKDWSRKSTPERIRDTIVSKIGHGRIVLLHDGYGDNFRADPEAPSRTVAGLAEALETVRDWGYEFVTVSQLMERHQRSASFPIWKRCLAASFMMLDRAIRWAIGVKHFRSRDDFVHGHVKTYRGPTLVLSDGTKIERGDLILNLHFNNEMMMRMAKEANGMTQLAVQLVRSGSAFLPFLARRLEHDPQLQKVKALYGVSLLYRGTRQFGFDVFDLPDGFFRSFAGVYLRLMMAVIHPDGKERIERRTQLLVPKIVAMSREQFVSRYLHGSEQPKGRSRSPALSSR